MNDSAVTSQARNPGPNTARSLIESRAAALIRNRQKKWTRLAGMGWDEIRTRLGQEASKRWDWARYRAGMGSRRNGSGPRLIARGRFFFSSDELTSRVALLKVHLPRQVDRILEQAD